MRLRLRRKPKPPAPNLIRLIPSTRDGRQGYDAYMGEQRLAFGTSPSSATESARTSLSIAGTR